MWGCIVGLWVYCGGSRCTVWWGKGVSLIAFIFWRSSHLPLSLTLTTSTSLLVYLNFVEESEAWVNVLQAAIGRYKVPHSYCHECN